MKPRSKFKLVSVGIIEGPRHEYLIALSRTEPDSTRLWQFPRGAANHGESPESAMRRIAAEKLGLAVDIEIGQPPLVEVIDGETVEVRGFFCTVRGGVAEPKCFEEIRWIAKAHLREYAFDALSQTVADWILAD